MSGDDNNNIPSINIITDVVPPPSATSLLPSPASGLLSPTNAYGPSSPTVSDAGSIPPSPTLSSHSVTPYKSTVQLRDNVPDQNSGLTSLGLLNPNSHRRKLSNATSVTETESDLRHVSSARTSFTHVDRPNSEKISLDAGNEHEGKDEKKKKKKKKGESAEDEEPTKTNHQLELAQDEAIDPKPFQFKPYQLAHMLDPKSLEALIAMGGIQGLLRGLGTDAERGLSTEDASTRHEKHGLGSGASHSEKSHNNEKPPEIVLTEPSGNIGIPTDDRSAFAASFDDRKRVYGRIFYPRASARLFCS
jgi:Ca2+-transporting ATPase